MKIFEKKIQKRIKQILYMYNINLTASLGEKNERNERISDIDQRRII